MLGRFAPGVTQVTAVVSHQQNRNMATLKAISMRLKSVKNIQKITQSMKMVSAAKYTRAERDLRAARPYGEGAVQFYEKAEVQVPEDEPKQLYIAMTSDRGLCGAVHTGVSKVIRLRLAEPGAENIKVICVGDKSRAILSRLYGKHIISVANEPGAENIKVICVGDKSRAILSRLYGKHIISVANEIGRLPPTFLDAAKLASGILTSGYEFGSGKIIYNKFRSVVSYAQADLPLFSRKAVEAAPKLAVYDSLDSEVLQSYMEFSLASMLFYALKEGACSEQSSRMTAMDNASKNAGEMIDKLTLTFNRTRQAVITRELIEIISGAAALE